MTLEIIKLDGLARMSLMISSKGDRWRMPTIVRPILHQASLDYISSMPGYQGTIESWLEEARNVARVSEKNVEVSEIFSPMIMETFPSVQFQQFDPDQVLTSRRLGSFLLLPVDRVLFQTNQYEKYLDRILDSGMTRDQVPDLALSFPFLGKEANLETIADKVLEINPDIVVLSDISSLLGHPRKLIHYLEQYHVVFDVKHVAWAPRVPLQWIPFLVYLGIDLFDELAMNHATKLGLVLGKLGTVEERDLHHLGLLSTRGRTLVEDDRDDSSLIKVSQDLNERFFFNMFTETLLAISTGRLRDLVRSTANIHPVLKLALRLLNTSNVLSEMLESNVSLQLPNILWCTDETDIDRPEVTRYQKWSRERWLPPDDVACCVILPCSAKKPYRSSHSHHLFTRILQSTLGKWYHHTQEIIFTSPFGGVPRALDMSHPLSSYDVTVTGEWSLREAERSASHLRDMIAKIPPRVPVVVYLSDVESRVVKPHLENLPHEVIFVNVSESPTKESSLESLRQALSRVRELLEQNDELKSVKSERKGSLHSDREILRAVLSYQFSRSSLVKDSHSRENPLVEAFLKEPLRIRGKRRIQLKFFHGKKQLGTFHGNNGLITLTLHGSELLVEHQVNLVKVNTSELRGGTVYLPAIEDADLTIVPGAPVAVVKHDEPTQLLASGKALLPGVYLKSLSRGAGVIIKHKKK